MVEAMKAGDAKVDTYLASGLTDVNGWQVGSLPGDRAHYNDPTCQPLTLVAPSATNLVTLASPAFMPSAIEPSPQ